MIANKKNYTNSNMYCAFNATINTQPETGNWLGWPFESNYGYFCDQRDKGEYPWQPNTVAGRLN